MSAPRVAPDGRMTSSGAVEEAFERVLERPVGPDEHFFEVGGSSMLALALALEIERATGRELSIAEIYNAPSIRAMNAFLALGAAPEATPVITLRKGVAGPALFLVHGLGGTAVELHQLARQIEGDLAIHGIQAIGLDGQTPNDSVEAMASCYVDMILALQPRGPYLLAGYSLGGLVAFDMARRLLGLDHEIGFLGLIDAFPDEATSKRHLWVRVPTCLRTPGARMTTLRRTCRRLATWPYRVFRGRIVASRRELALPASLRAVRAAARVALRTYRPVASDCDMIFFQATGRPEAFPPDPVRSWRPLVRRLTIDDVPGDHASLVRGESAALAAALTRRLRSAALPG